MESLIRLADEAAATGNAERVSPSIVVGLTQRDGKQTHLHASGTSGTTEPLTADSVFWVGSLSKLIAAVASMQTVERGLIGLDDDVTTVLPELATLSVLDGKEDGNGVPTTTGRKGAITLRLLLSHQSGAGYDNMYPQLMKWGGANGLNNTTLDNTLISMKTCPLLFQPGTSWSYGAGIDWAGLLVSRLNGISLESYYQKHILEPLGMTSTTFHPANREDLKQRIVSCFQRSEDGTTLSTSPVPVPLESQEECAGHGIWTSPRDYLKLLGAMLEDGGSLLSKASTDEIFKPQLIHPESILPSIHGPFKFVLGPMIPQDTPASYGLAGLVNPDNIPGRRAAGTLQWSGAPNLIWWVDRKTGVAATAFLQLMPVGDAKASRFHMRFEEEVYKMLA